MRNEAKFWHWTGHSWCRLMSVWPARCQGAIGVAAGAAVLMPSQLLTSRGEDPCQDGAAPAEGPRKRPTIRNPIVRSNRSRIVILNLFSVAGMSYEFLITVASW